MTLLEITRATRSRATAWLDGVEGADALALGDLYETTCDLYEHIIQELTRELYDRELDFTHEERQAADVINEAAREAAEVERRFRDLEREVTDEPIDEVVTSGAFTNTVDPLFDLEKRTATESEMGVDLADPNTPSKSVLVWNGYSLPDDIDKLPTDEKHALAFELHERGMSHAQIHEATGIPRGSVKYSIERGMAKRDRQTKPAATKDEAVKIVQVLHIAVAEKRRDTNDIASFFPGLTGGIVAVIFTDYARELEELQRVYDEGSRDDYQRAKGELLKALKGEK